MKRFFIFSSLLWLIATTALAQGQYIFITGTITNQLTGLPIANHEVYIFADSVNNFQYSNIEYTDNNGVYGDTILIPPQAPGQAMQFEIWTPDCNGNFQTMVVLSLMSPIVADFSLCGQSPPPCMASFDYYPDPNDPLTLHFVETSIGITVSRFWDFGDGTTSNVQNPDHTYPASGIYNATLSISTIDSCQSTATKAVSTNDTINSSCFASFYYMPDMSALNGFFFISTSSPDAVAWFWDFGDGSTSIDENPHHIFWSTGIYPVTLVISTANGCTSTFSTVVFVGNPQNCQASFLAAQDPNDLFTYTFTDNSMGNVVNWSWDFGDGSVSNLQNPVHSFQIPGAFNVKLSIITSDSCWSDFMNMVFPGDTSNVGCQAQFSVFADSTGFGYTFVDASLGNPFSWDWSFGDGTSGTGQIVHHVYNQPGTYTVCLTISGANGCAQTACYSVVVGGGPTTFPIFGYVSAMNTLLNAGTVVLYRFDPMSCFVQAIDTTLVDSTGFYEFCCVLFMPTTFYIKAIPAPGSNFFGTHVPTYYQNAMMWSDASPIFLGPNLGPVNIELVPMNIPPSGNGGIGGTITQGNKMFASGVPVPDIEVMIMDLNNTPLMVDYSDVSGWFSFSNLPLGTYKVYPEVAFVSTTPAIITLTSGQPVINSVNMIFSGSGISVGMQTLEQEHHGTSVISVFPQPARDHIYVVLQCAKAENMQLKINDLSGKTLISKTIETGAGEQMITLPAEELSPGIYLLNLSNGNDFNKNVKITLTR